MSKGCLTAHGPTGSRKNSGILDFTTEIILGVSRDEIGAASTPTDGSRSGFPDSQYNYVQYGLSRPPYRTENTGRSCYASASHTLAQNVRRSRNYGILSPEDFSDFARQWRRSPALETLSEETDWSKSESLPVPLLTLIGLATACPPRSYFPGIKAPILRETVVSRH